MKFAVLTLLFNELYLLLACLHELARATIRAEMLNWTFLQGKTLFKNCGSHLIRGPKCERFFSVGY